jgi:Raf kinase inhibitor-like YbhB/YbcL family protein
MKYAIITVTSTAFKLGGVIPERHIKGGANLSPPLAWSGVPEEAKELVLIVEDPDVPGPPSPFAHWVVYGLPPATSGLPEGVSREGDKDLPAGAAQGRNAMGYIGYDGPAPPPGKPHRYRFIVTAVDRPLGLEHGATREEVEAAMEGRIVGRGEIVGLYGVKQGASAGALR